MRRPRSIAFAAAAILTIAPLAFVPAAAQQKSGVVTESAAVTVIEIPVNVVGKDGKPVQSLKASDFELFDENKKVELSGFEVIDVSRPAAAASAVAKDPFAELPPPAARRHWLLVFDLSYSTPTGLVRARAGARDFLEKQLAPQDLASVATLSSQNGWKLLVNFTADRKQLERAVDTLGFAKTGVRTSDPLAFAFEQPAQGMSSGGGGKAMDDIVREQIEDLQRMQQTSSDERERGKANQLLNSLGMMGRVLDSVRGRKHVLFFSEGFESRLLTGNAGQMSTPLDQSSPGTADNANEASLNGEHWKINSDSRFGSSASQNRLVNALAGYKRSDTTLHSIDISGLHAEGDVGRKVGAGADALFAIAAETNGDFIRNANQLGTEIGKIAERTAITYLLVYQPRGLTKPGTFHNLKIKVNAPGARVMARSGFYEPRPFRALTPLERVLASGDLVVGGQRTEEIPARVIAAPFPAETGVAQVPVVIEIGGAQLVAGDPGPKTGVEIYAYAIDRNGTLADYTTQELSLELAKVRTMLEGGGIKYYATLFVPPGEYTLRVLARNAATGRSAVVAQNLSVPVFPGGATTLLAPFFPEAPGRWLMVKGTPRPDAAPHTAEYPFAVAGESFIPAADPQLSNGSETQVAVMAYNLPDASVPLNLRSEVVGPDGKSRPATVSIAKRSDGEKGGGRKLLVKFKPEGLTPGAYRLKVALLGAGGKTFESVGAFEIR